MCGTGEAGELVFCFSWRLPSRAAASRRRWPSDGGCSPIGLRPQGQYGTVAVAVDIMHTLARLSR